MAAQQEIKQHLDKLSDADLIAQRRHLAGQTGKLARPEGLDKTIGAYADIGVTLAKSMSDEEWIAMLRNGVRPDAVVLSPRQLETINGGDFSWGAFATTVAGGAAGGAVATIWGGPLSMGGAIAGATVAAICYAYNC